MSEIPCYCGSKSGELLRRKIRGGKSREIIRCDGCGTVRKRIRSAGDHEAFHRESGQSAEIDLDPNSEEYKERNLIDIDRRKRAMQRFLNDDTVLLDFGTGMGEFLDVIEDEVGKSIGCEINDQQADFVRNQLGIPVFEDLEDVVSAIGADSVDILTMFHVLEHLVHPLKYLEDFHHVLDEDGVLIIEVPNHDDWLLAASDAYAQFYYQDAHSYYFDPDTLKDLVEMAGYRVDIVPVQRYGFKNALHWIRTGEPELEKPSRHDPDGSVVSRIYEKAVVSSMRSDTLFAICRPDQ